MSVFIIDPRCARVTKELKEDLSNKDEIKIAPSVCSTNKEMQKVLSAYVPYLIVIVNESNRSCNFELYGTIILDEEF